MGRTLTISIVREGRRCRILLLYAQKEQFEAWMWLQPLCQQLAKINNTLSPKAEFFVFAENDDEEKWFSMDSGWYCVDKPRYTGLAGRKKPFPDTALIGSDPRKMSPECGKKLMEERDDCRMVPPAAFQQIVTTEVAKLTRLDLSRTFAEQSEMILSLIVELKRNNDLREREIRVFQEHAGVVGENTVAVRENTWTLHHSNALLCAIRDGKVQLPPEVMNALAEAFRQSNESALQAAQQKMKGHSWKDKGQLLRDLLGDAANLTTVGSVLVTLEKDYGPTLLKLITALVPV